MKKVHLFRLEAGGLRWPGSIGLIALLIVISGTMAWGKVAGPCVNCHTMHNSQDGSSVVKTTFGLEQDIEMQFGLTNTDCVGCHSSDTETIRDLGNGTRIPIVYTTNEPSLTPGASNSMLAGGNFYWVASDDTKGHNVYRISGIDSNLSNAPGASTGCSPCHNTLATANSGCRGCHFPAHHADDSATVVDGAHGSYRFLGDVMHYVFNGWPPETSGFAGSSTAGVKGIEDEDWEQDVSSNKHNGYKGTTTNYPSASAGPYLSDSSIGQMCAGCHGNFHHQMNTDGDLSGAWIRHPSDVIIPNEGEYAAYTIYNPLAPVAKQNLTEDMKNSPTVTPGEDLVTCISCHRPHGSPYPDMLRWDYDTCTAGSANAECGCYVCHTAKDG